MPIPYFQAIMLPFMQHIAAGQEHTTTDTRNNLAYQFAFTHDNNTRSNNGK
jgi:restriction endonuclease Mrr